MSHITYVDIETGTIHTDPINEIFLEEPTDFSENEGKFVWVCRRGFNSCKISIQEYELIRSKLTILK